MRKLFFAVSLLLCIAVAVFSPVPAIADTVPYFTYSLDRTSAAPDDLVKLKINAGSVSDPAAGFRMIIHYDDTVLSFVRTETSSQIKSGTLVTNSTGNPIYSVYVCNVDGNAAPVLSGNIISFVFKVKDGSSADKTAVGAQIDQVCNYQAEQLNLNYDEDLTLTVKQPEELSDEAYLRALEPMEGRMIPEFSEDIFKYAMQVNYDVTSVEFSALPGESGTVKINRKTLGKAGTDTNIIVTVTSEDKKVKAQYVVAVNRAFAPVETLSDSESTKAKPESRAAPAGNLSPALPTGAKQTELAETGTAPAAAEQPPQNTQTATSEAPAPPGFNDRGDRNIYLIGNQMPTFVVGMLTAALCIMIGISLSFWLKIKPKQ
jgi:hypothetical protein